MADQMHNVVQLDGHITLPPFRFPHTFTKYTHTTSAEVVERLKDATIVILAATALPRDVLINHAPNVKLISSLGAGTDKVDIEAVRERGIVLTNTPAQNTTTVAEHALALYFAVKRKIVDLHAFTMDGEAWGRNGMSVGQFGGMVPRVCEEETVGIIGYGALGKRMESLCKALSMNVLIAERKTSPTTRPGRTPFTTVLQKSTLLILLCPLDPSTHNMLSHHELSLLSPTTILVNVSRGGIVNESALAAALREGKLAGAGIDVFGTEPATKESCGLLKGNVPGLVVTPHLAWFSGQTVEKTKSMVRETVEGFVRGELRNVVVGPGVKEGERERERVRGGLSE